MRYVLLDQNRLAEEFDCFQERLLTPANVEGMCLLVLRAGTVLNFDYHRQSNVRKHCTQVILTLARIILQRTWHIK